jgi:hypothetical protein
LKFSSKTAALPITKLLNSAVANAVHNFQLNREDLVVQAITVDGGPVMKRMFPRAQGQAHVIRRRMSHINIVLISRPKTKSKKKRSMFTGLAIGKTPKTEKAEKNETQEGKVDSRNDKPKVAPKSEEKIKTQTSSLKRRLFNRKSGE